MSLLFPVLAKSHRNERQMGGEISSTKESQAVKIRSNVKKRSKTGSGGEPERYPQSLELGNLRRTSSASSFDRTTIPSFMKKAKRSGRKTRSKFRRPSLARRSRPTIVSSAGSMPSEGRRSIIRGKPLKKLTNLFRPNTKAGNKRRNSKVRGSDGIQWLNTQRTELDGERAQLLQAKFEEVFSRLSKSVRINVGKKEEQRKTVNKNVFLTTCTKLFGDHIDSYMFSKLFDFMDSDKNGVVDEVEFSITACFLLKKGSFDSNTQLAYNIFDSNHSGGLSRKEFSEMLAAIVGSSLKTVENLTILKPIFEEFIETRKMMDNLSFYRTMKRFIKVDNDNIDNEPEYLTIPSEDLEHIMKTYFLEKSPMKLNISHELSVEVLETYYESISQGLSKLSAKYFKNSFDSIVYLLESNALLKFKTYLRKEPYTKITIDVWERFSLSTEDQLSYEQFSLWTSDNPGIFEFFSDIQKDMEILVHSLEKAKIESAANSI